jgi:8-oxo-dGTP pyrophosphatase MutT (NUDIX family)
MIDLVAPDDPRLIPSTDLDVARAQIEAATGVDPGQATVRRRMLDFLDDHADAAERTCAAGHLTGSALVVDGSGPRVLVLFHRKARRWLQPGGHADGDTNLARVALRESTEESGIDGLRVALPAIDLDIHEVDFGPEPAHLHLDVRFLVIAPDGAVPAINDESEDAAWVALDELAARADGDAGIVRMANRGVELWRQRV